MPTPTKPTADPLASSVAREALDWDHVEPRRSPADLDVLGLSASDRNALGLSTPRTQDFVTRPFGDAQDALREVLLAGGNTSRKADKPRRR